MIASTSQLGTALLKAYNVKRGEGYTTAAPPIAEKAPTLPTSTKASSPGMVGGGGPLKSSAMAVSSEGQGMIETMENGNVPIPLLIGIGAIVLVVLFFGR